MSLTHSTCTLSQFQSDNQFCAASIRRAELAVSLAAAQYRLGAVRKETPPPISVAQQWNEQQNNKEAAENAAATGLIRSFTPHQLALVKEAQKFDEPLPGIIRFQHKLSSALSRPAEAEPTPRLTDGRKQHEPEQRSNHGLSSTTPILRCSLNRALMVP
jgi:hypothetical protein